MNPLRYVVVLMLAIATAALPVTKVDAQQGCLPAGGDTVPEAKPASGDFVFTGHGVGHGVGMSQFGAQGAAKLGCDAHTILETYFPGASVEALRMPPELVVGLAQSQRTVHTEAARGTINWELCGPKGSCITLPISQPTGTGWTVAVQDDASYEILRKGQSLWSGGDEEHVLQARLSLADADDRVMRLPLTGARYKWGLLRFDSVQHDRPTMFVTLEVPSVDRYLYGIAEVPATWPTEALRAQAIAARSYVVSKVQQLGLRSACRCHLYPDSRDQTYRGFEGEVVDSSPDHGWTEAVMATAREVLRYQERTVTAFYATSHGGHSESSAFAFGREYPELQPVDDSRWDLASDNPSRSWTSAVTADHLGKAVGVGRAKTVTLLEPFGAAGRVGDPKRGYGGVRIEGTAGSVTLSGEALRRALALRSTLFKVSG
jgi:stage II sporulation protein D